MNLFCDYRTMARTKQTARKHVGGRAGQSTGVATRYGARASQNIPQPGQGGAANPQGQTRRYRPGTRALMQIRAYQRSTELLIQKLPFQRYVREIMSECQRGQPFVTRIGPKALFTLQEATEAFLIELFRQAYLITTHTSKGPKKGKSRQTITPADIKLALKIRGDFLQPTSEPTWTEAEMRAARVKHIGPLKRGSMR